MSDAFWLILAATGVLASVGLAFSVGRDTRARKDNAMVKRFKILTAKIQEECRQLEALCREWQAATEVLQAEVERLTKEAERTEQERKVLNKPSLRRRV